MRTPSPPYDSLTFVRCRIEGRFNGKDFIYEDPIGTESLCFHHKEDKESQKSIVDYYWSEGTMSDNANRIRFVPLMDMRDEDEFTFDRHNNNYDIEIKTITPLEGDFPVIELNEY